MTTVRIPALEAMLVKLRRSTLPLGPFVEAEWDRRVLARVLRQSRRRVLKMAAGKHHWSRGYHVRMFAEALLRETIRQGGNDELVAICRRLLAIVTTAPMWRGRAVTGREAKELSTDGPIQD